MLAGVAVLAVLPASVARAAPAAPVPLGGARPPVAVVTETFGYVGPMDQSTVVPQGVSSVRLRVIGGHGGADCAHGYCTGGGDGAEVTGTIAVTAGQVLTLKVAGRGGDNNGNTNPGDGGWGWATGGRGGSATGSASDGAGGGGASSVAISACAGCEASLAAVAGGGGGTGGTGYFPSVDTPGPGGSSGATADSGHDGGGPGSGSGGAGAGNGSSSGGGGGAGEHLGGAGGGGGAGSTGGAGGGGGGFGGGGGGGGGAGSSLTTGLTSPVVVRGTTGDGNGLIEVTWDRVTAPMHLTERRGGEQPVLTVSMPADATGQVEFYKSALPEADQLIAVVPIISGVALLHVRPERLIPGDNPIIAFYRGDARYLPSHSNTLIIFRARRLPGPRTKARRCRRGPKPSE